MTVASLWKALDRAGCGRAIGKRELQDHKQLKSKMNPWNCNELQQRSVGDRPTLAVDLSIWICESLTSAAISNNHADPALQLVYTRTLKLLNLGVKLVGVIEGKRRVRRTDGDGDEFQKRRSGTNFWRACQRCEEMLRLLGVPVVRAKAEGEALCAFLNQRGIVDGVISKDGDCLLFGAKVVYTNFSIENLEQSRVMRYDASDIRACVDDDDRDEYGAKGADDKVEQTFDIVKLSRSDLMAFAILTGSDIVGNGIPKVGCRKAIRFIKKCQIDNPMKADSAAIDELNSWSMAASACGEVSTPTESQGRHQNCSCCAHPGNKRIHQKEGCKLCGTGPGESCFPVSPGGRFRRSLRSKALKMKPKFDPESVVEAYLHPNDDQLPLDLIGKSAASLEMGIPRLQDMLQSSLIIRGRSFAESREYVRQSLSSLLARTELLDHLKKSDSESEGDHPKKLPTNKNRPLARKVTNALIRDGNASFEVQWLVKATTTDVDGNPIDEFEFSTIEEQSLIKKCYPKLVERFEEDEHQRKKQGSAEQERRRTFLSSMCDKQKEPTKQEGNQCKPATRKNHRHKSRRGNFFVTERSSSLVVSAANPVASALGLKGSVISGAVVKDQNLRTSIPNDPLKPVFKKERAKNKSQLGEMRPSSTFIAIVEPKRIRVSTDRGLLEKMDGEAKCSYEGGPPHRWGDDVDRLLRFIENGNDTSPEFDYSTIDTASVSSSGSIVEGQILNKAEDGCAVTTPGKAVHCLPNLTPGHIHFLGTNCGDKALAFNCAPSDSHRLAEISIQKGSSTRQLRVPAIERGDLPRDDNAVCASKSSERRFDANRSHVAQYQTSVLLAKDICSSPDLKRHRSEVTFPLKLGEKEQSRCCHSTGTFKGTSRNVEPVDSHFQQVSVERAAGSTRTWGGQCRGHKCGEPARAEVGVFHAEQEAATSPSGQTRQETQTHQLDSRILQEKVCPERGDEMYAAATSWVSRETREGCDRRELSMMQRSSLSAGPQALLDRSFKTIEYLSCLSLGECIMPNGNFQKLHSDEVGRDHCVFQNLPMPSDPQTPPCLNLDFLNSPSDEPFVSHGVGMLDPMRPVPPIFEPTETPSGLNLDFLKSPADEPLPSYGVGSLYPPAQSPVADSWTDKRQYFDIPTSKETAREQHVPSVTEHKHRHKGIVDNTTSSQPNDPLNWLTAIAMASEWEPHRAFREPHPACEYFNETADHELRFKQREAQLDLVCSSFLGNILWDPSEHPATPGRNIALNRTA